VTASAAIASAIFAAEEVDAATHKVKSGDSLWSIAQKYGTNVSTLKSINKLSSDVIFPNQLIETSKSSDSGSDRSKDKGNSGDSGNRGGSGGSTYTVKAGDTLSGIASRHNIALQNLMKWNNLNTTLIFPGNVFVVSDPGKNNAPSNPPKKDTKKKDEQKTETSKVYTVKSGDTLSHIARAHNVTVANLKKWNNLTSDLIHIGQKLSIGKAKNDNGGTKPPAT